MKTLVGIAADHGGFELKNYILNYLIESGFKVRDFGAFELVTDDDYPEMVIPLARAVGLKQLARGIAICGSGIGACIAANKIKNVRAGLANEIFSVKQGVHDDDMNVLCLGARLISPESAKELVRTFLEARFSSLPRHSRRLKEIAQYEKAEV